MQRIKSRNIVSVLVSCIMVFALIGTGYPQSVMAAELSVPTNLAAVKMANVHDYTADRITASVTLTWDGTAESYVVYRKSFSGEKWNKIGESKTKTYTDISLSNNEIYEYAVAALNTSAESSLSKAVKAMVYSPVYAFDFGGQNRAGFAASYVSSTDYVGAVQSGYTEVTPTTVYGQEGRGYGLKTAGTRSNSFAYDSVNEKNTGNGWALKQDMIIMTEAGFEFKADLPNGTYLAWVLAGDLIDPSGKNTSNYSIDGNPIGTITTAAKEMKDDIFEFTVTDGTMNLTTTGNWGRTSALIITPVRTAPAGFDGSADMAQSAVNLKWDETDASSYNIYRGLVGIEGYSLLAKEVNGTSYKDTTVKAGQEYVYKISANCLTGESVPSDAITVEVYDTAVAKPEVPTNIIGKRSTETSVKLTWDKADNAQTFYVWRALESDKQFSLVASLTKNSFEDSKLEPNKNYIYKMVAANNGGKSKESAEVLVKALIPDTVEGLTASSVSHESATLIWNAVYSADGYKVYRAGTQKGTYEYVADAPYTTYTDKALKASTEYYYKVSAFNEGGQSVQCGDIKATTIAMPSILPAPDQFVKAEVTAMNIKLSWKSSIGAIKYKLYKATALEGNYELLSELDDLSYTDSDVVKGMTYYYKLIAVNAAGESKPSNVVSASTYKPLWVFDFGANTNYIEGAKAVNSTTALYSDTQGYGMDSAIWRDYPRSEKDGLLEKGEDFALVTDATNLDMKPVLKANVPNGKYQVSIYSGETSTARSRSNFNVYLEDELAGLVYVDKGAGLKEKSFTTTVNDGLMDIAFQALKKGEYIRINYIVISPISAAADYSPVNVSATSSDNNVSLKWDAMDGATEYNVYRAMAADGDFVKVAQTSQTKYTDTIRTTVPYYYKVSAVVADMETAKSETAKAKTVAKMAPYQEKLDRGLVAVKTDTGIFISWRLFDTDTNETYFNIYRDGKLIKSTGDTNYLDDKGKTSSKYKVAAVVNGKVTESSAQVKPLTNDYLSIKLVPPADGVTSDGKSYFYKANDASVADLDGDGVYEIILKWDPSNSQDNSAGTITGNTYIDAYKLDGTRLWRIDLGKNIRSGAHYSPFMVYDFDGDGKAEMAVKTADGTIDGLGNIIGRWDADYVNTTDHLGMILEGPEYLTVFDGLTGKALDTVNYEVARGNVSDWGDSTGNRVDRFLAGVAYLDGETPSFVMCRGYYAKTTLTAYTFKAGKIKKQWSFNTDVAGLEYTGQGNHNLTVTDVDYDGCDEIIYGALTVDNDGTAMYTTGLKHGDAMHVSDIDLDRPGLEVFAVHEEKYCSELHDARTGEVIWKHDMTSDVGRGVSADIDPTSPGMEAWNSSKSVDTGANIGIMSSKGEVLDNKIIPPVNFAVWWDGDLLRELFDGSESNASNIRPYIYKYKDMDGNIINDKIRVFEGMDVNNYTKANPCLTGDILGDWREEVILRSLDNTELRIYTTTIPTEYRIPTLVQNHQYRMALAWQNTGYNQPPHTSYYLGSDMKYTTGFTAKIPE